MRAPRLVDISKLSLNSKIKKFSYSFIYGKGYSPPFRGENSFLSTVCGRAMRAPAIIYRFKYSAICAKSSLASLKYGSMQ